MVELIDIQNPPRLYDIGALFHEYAKGMQKKAYSLKDTPYLAYNFQRQVLGDNGLIHNCEGLDIQDVMLDLFLGCHQVQMIASTGGDGTLAKVTTAARKSLDSIRASVYSGNPDSQLDLDVRSIDDILFLHNRAGTQEVVPTYYNLPKFWQSYFAAGVYKFLNCGRSALKIHRVPQLKVTSSFTQDGMTHKTEDYGGMLIGAALNKFLREHYRVAKIFDPVPHSIADLSIIGRGIIQPGYARDFLKPVRGSIKLDGEELPIDSWNFLTVFSNDWFIDMKLTKLNPCVELRKYQHLPESRRPLQILVGNATMPAITRTVLRQAVGLDWGAEGIISRIGHKVEIETEEHHFNLEGDFHRTDGKITAESGYHFNLVADHSQEYLKGAFSGDQELFNKFLHDFSQR